MNAPISIENAGIERVAAMKPRASAPRPQTPFRILVLGDFSGRSPAGRMTEGFGRALPVDRDDLDSVLGRIQPGLQLALHPADDRRISVDFSRLEDFHPDRLYHDLEVFENLRRIRRELNDSRTFDRAAREIAAWSSTPSASEPASEAPAKTPADEAGLLDQVLDQSEGAPSVHSPQEASTDWSRFLRGIVQPHLSPAEEPRKAEFVSAVDAALSDLMRAVLHHPDFQALEAAWRGVDFLVRGVETGENLKVYLLDVSKDQLAADLDNAASDLRESELYRTLVKEAVETAGADPWSLAAGVYTFEADPTDARLLARIAAVAAAAGAPFIAAAHCRLLGCESLAQAPDPDDWTRQPDRKTLQAWSALRRLPQAAHIGLALPRFLLRLPYGEETDPVETFPFEEMEEGLPIHEHYLWGNPSLACSQLLGRAFCESGWNLRPGGALEIGGLPLHTHRGENGYQNQPCAEVLLTERAAAAILEAGLMPLLSFRDRDMVRLARWQSIADPPTALAGPWN